MYTWQLPSEHLDTHVLIDGNLKDEVLTLYDTHIHRHIHLTPNTALVKLPIRTITHSAGYSARS